MSPIADQPEKSRGLLAVIARPSIATAAPLIVGGLITLAAFEAARRTGSSRIRAEFVQEVQYHLSGLQTKITRDTESLLSVRDLFLLSGKDGEFERIAREMLDRQTAVSTIAWLPIVSHAKRAETEEWARSSGAKEFQFITRGSLGDLMPVPNHTNYHPALFIVPFDNPHIALGQDLGVKAEFQKLLGLARNDGRLRISERFENPASADRSSVNLIAPVHDQDPKPETLLDRQKQIQEYVVGVWNVAGLINQAILDARRDSVHSKAIDQSGGGSDLLHSTLPPSFVLNEDTLHDNGLPDSVYIKDRDGRYLAMNRADQRFVGIQDEIEHSTQRASELCQQMLDYSGQNRHEEQRLDLNATIKQTLPFLRHSTGKHAVDLARASPNQFCLVLMDFSMPVLDGAKASLAIKELNESLPIMLMSGYWEEKATSTFTNGTMASFIKKPFSPEKLRDEVKPAIEKA